MTPLSTLRAKFALAAFLALTLLYGSLCSTTCALGACPTETQNAASHDCDHNSSNPLHHSTPQNPDCPKHHHPAFDALQADSLAQSQLPCTKLASAAQLFAVTTLHNSPNVPSPAWLSDLAPPPNLNLPLHQKISQLRI